MARVFMLGAWEGQDLVPVIDIRPGERELHLAPKTCQNGKPDQTEMSGGHDLFKMPFLAFGQKSEAATELFDPGPCSWIRLFPNLYSFLLGSPLPVVIRLRKLSLI